jgi:type II secretory pathway pseudopilin PulG
MKRQKGEGGYTLVELLVSLMVLGFIALGSFELLTALLHSSIVSKRQAVAYTLATNQMEYLKSLPYDNLAIAGGSIPSNNTLPASFSQKVNGDNYTVKTAISYTDDAYDGCGSYPSQALKQLYCRNYPPPSGAPATDTNPADTKSVTVTVTDVGGRRLSFLDTNIAARVAETASNTGALFVKVVDNSGTPVSGATVTATNSTTSPSVNVSDTTDENGITIFYGLPPDSTNFDYNVTASLSGYSTLTTIKPAGALQPTYPNQNLLTQSSALVTLKIMPQGQNSLVIESTDTAGNPLASAKIYVKGGYKRYNSTTDTSYYYDTLRITDTRPVTDAGGLSGLDNLVPGDYIFCGDTGATSCSVGATTYYLAAAVPYGGTNPLNPVTVPTNPSSPPATTFIYGGNNYLQKVRLMLTTNSNFPRLTSLTPYSVDISSDPVANMAFALTGANLPCSASAASCGTQVKFVQGANTFTASCTGSSAGLQLNCNVNLSAAVVGQLQLVVTANGQTLTLPGSPLLGGPSVNP